MTPSASVQNALTFIGRALIALLFIPEGVHQVGQFAGTVGYISSKGLPLAEVAAAVSIAVHIGLGLALLIGFKARWAALGLAIFTFIITFIFHDFWAAPAAQAMTQQFMFFKNLAVVGGLLGIVAWGPGGWSIDGLRN